MRIAKNRKKLIDKILDNAEHINYTYNDGKVMRKGKFEYQDDGKKAIQKELLDDNFRNFLCDNDGSCSVNSLNYSYYFYVNPAIIQEEFDKDTNKRLKRHEKSKEYHEKLDELGVASLPKGMSIEELKGKLDTQKQKSDQISSQYSPQPPEPTITISIDGTCDELYQFTNQNQIWDNPQEPSMDSFGNRLARRINKSLMSKCPEKQYSQGMEKLGFKKHLKPTD